jgi:PAS domain S-box-containing protein
MARPNAQPVLSTRIDTAATDCRLRSYRVLIVDDMPSIHEDMRKVLLGVRPNQTVNQLEQEIFGTSPEPELSEVRFQIDSAFQANEALERVRNSIECRQPYAVAFVDMRMPPGEDGLHTIVGMWAIDPNIQIVMCSAYSDYSWRQTIAKTGETDQLVILRKPFESIELTQLAHALGKKWDLHRTARQHVESLEAQVRDRTQQLGEKQAIFQLILDNVADLIAVVDANGNRIYNSPSYRTLLGFEPHDLQGTPALAEVHPDDAPAVRLAVEKAHRSPRHHAAPRTGTEPPTGAETRIDRATRRRHRARD